MTLVAEFHGTIGRWCDFPHATGVFFLYPAAEWGRRKAALFCTPIDATSPGQMMRKRARFHKTSYRGLVTKPIETLGEVFAGGTFIELVHDPSSDGVLKLLFWDGKTAKIAPLVKYGDCTYAPRKIDTSVARELHLPAEFTRSVSVKQLVEDLVAAIQRYSGLENVTAGLVARFSLASWVLESLPAAPTIIFVGPCSRELKQIFNLLKCLCRHAIPLTAVTVGGVCSLPMDIGLTLLIEQPEFSKSFEQFLIASRNRESKLPRHGRLLSAFCAKAIHSPSYSDAATIGAAAVPVVPTDRSLPTLDDQERARIIEEFQPRLLRYRFEFLEKVRSSTFDCGVPHVETRESINGFAACTPESADLQAEILRLVPDQAAEARQARWCDPTVITIESLLLGCHTPDRTKQYMGDTANAMKAIFSARGEEREFRPNQVGKMVRHLGFRLESRDNRGVKLLLTDATRRKIHELAVNFDVPSIETPSNGCSHCAAVLRNSEQSTEKNDSAVPEGQN